VNDERRTELRENARNALSGPIRALAEGRPVAHAEVLDAARTCWPASEAYAFGGERVPASRVVRATQPSQIGVHARPVLAQGQKSPEHTTQASPVPHSASLLQVVVAAKVPQTVPPSTRVQQKQVKGVGVSGQSMTTVPWHVLGSPPLQPHGPFGGYWAKAGVRSEVSTGAAQATPPATAARFNISRRSILEGLPTSRSMSHLRA
jgi:hypothetical protein